MLIYGSLTGNARAALPGGYPLRATAGGVDAIDIPLPALRGYTSFKASATLYSAPVDANVSMTLSLLLPKTPTALSASITFTNGSTTVTSSGVIFKPEWAADGARIFSIADHQTRKYRIASVTNATTLVLTDAARANATSTGASAALSALLFNPWQDAGTVIATGTAQELGATEATAEIDMPDTADILVTDPGTGNKVRCPTILGRVTVSGLTGTTMYASISKVWVA